MAKIDEKKEMRSHNRHVRIVINGLSHTIDDGTFTFSFISVCMEL